MRPYVPLALGTAVALSGLGGFISRKLPAGEAKAASPASSASSAPASPPLRVDVVRVSSEPLEVQVQATGTLLGRESVELVSELSRRLVKVRAEEGTSVKKGDVLFELDAADLRAELAQARGAGAARQGHARSHRELSSEGLSTSRSSTWREATRRRGRGASAACCASRWPRRVIRAPFAGTLGLRRVSEGAWVSPSTRARHAAGHVDAQARFHPARALRGRWSRRAATFRFKIAGSGETLHRQGRWRKSPRSTRRRAACWCAA